MIKETILTAGTVYFRNTTVTLIHCEQNLNIGQE